MFVKINHNPLNKNVNDCIVRAICVTESMTWIEVLMELHCKAIEEACLPNHEDAYGAYLKLNGYIKKDVRSIYPGYPKLHKFISDHPTMTAILDVEGHAVPIINGDYFDTFDHGYKQVYSYWEKL